VKLSRYKYIGQIGLGIYNEKDSLLKELVWYDAQFLGTETVDTVFVVEEGTLNDIPDGTYTIKGISRELVDGDYMPAQKMPAVVGATNKLTMAVAGTNVKISKTHDSTFVFPIVLYDKQHFVHERASRRVADSGRLALIYPPESDRLVNGYQQRQRRH